MIIGLTGCIGAGKSTVAKMFQNYEFAMQDSDKIVHDIYDNDMATISLIGTTFPGVVKQDKVDRVAMRMHIQENPEDKEKLEAIVHPVVKQYRQNFIAKNSNCILDVPLLFEAGIYEEVDVIVVVACDEETRKQRVLERGQTQAVFEMFNNAQYEQDEKIAQAHFVIYTDTDLKDTQQQVRDVVDQLL